MARHFLFDQPLQFLGKVFNFSSFFDAVSIDPYSGEFDFGAAVNIAARVEPSVIHTVYSTN